MVTIVAGESDVRAVRDALAGAATVATPAEWEPAAPVIIWLDGLAPSEIQHLEALIAKTGSRPIGVLGARWDGFATIPLAAHCRGVVSGFGYAGLRAAITTLQESPAR